MNDILAPKVDIAGVGVSSVDLQDTIDIFKETIRSKGKIRVCVTPVNCIVWTRNNEKLRDIYNSADLTLCDGVPMLWMSKFLGTPIKGRVTGLDLLPEFVAECDKCGFTMFLLGAKEGVAEELKLQFKKKYPNIKIVGVYSPPFAEKFSDEENRKMVEMINKVKPNIVWVSLTAPKQDYWIYEHLSKLDTNIAIGVGGAFEVSAGLIKRAPVFMQKLGLEWFFRFASEPKRLFRRYFIEAPVIFPMVIKQRFQEKL